MKFSHLHIGAEDLSSALAWFEDVGQLRPTFQNDRMASIPVDGTSLILDLAAEDSVTTIAFETSDCDTAYLALLARGAASVAVPENLSWGVRAAYVQGPGAMTIEIEQPLS